VCLSPLPVRGGLFKRLASEGSLTLVGEFSGQGRPWLGALRELDVWVRGAPDRAPLAALLDEALATVRALADDEEIQLTGVFRQGFDVAAWIANPEQAPQEPYLSSSDYTQRSGDGASPPARGLQPHSPPTHKVDSRRSLPLLCDLLCPCPARPCRTA